MKDRKVVLIGTGFVGMSAAYSMLNAGTVSELVLIDVNKDKADGEAMDLQHGLPYAPKHMIIRSGEYADCKDAELVVITAGVAQKEDETRLDLTRTNTKIMKSIVEEVVASGFDGVFVIASNPVDILSYVTWKVSGFPKEKVIGSGTILDTARLRYMMSEYLNVSSNNIHAYILGEHGDSSFVPWTHAYVGAKSLLELLDEKKRPLSDLHDIYTQVQQAGYEIVKRKRATYYGIGLSLNRLVKAILDDEHVVISASTLQEKDTYGEEDVYISVPIKIGKNGVEEVIKLDLNDVDQQKFHTSAQTLKDVMDEVVKPILEDKGV